MRSSLEGLPVELLARIVSYIENAQTLLRFSLCCKKLHGYIEHDGYRVFTQSRFSSGQLPAAFWKEATRALTTRSQAFSRKSLVARQLKPKISTPEPHAHRGNERRHRGQTMGYQPVIDSYESWAGNDWTSRREVLAWGAGSELFLRCKKTGKETGSDEYRCRTTWSVVKDPIYQDGRNDITTVNLLRPTQKPADSSEYVVIGRASGELDLISVGIKSSGSWRPKTRFLTQGRHVRSASINATATPLLAACLGDHTIALYLVNSTCNNRTDPIGEIEVASPMTSCRIWSSAVLQRDRLAVGLGPSNEPIQIFEVRPDGISNKPVRKFPLNEGYSIANGELRTVYPLVGLPRSSSAGGADGDLFLSGGVDGITRYKCCPTSVCSC